MLPLLLVLLVVSVFAGPLQVPRAHAVVTGQVCLADPSTAVLSSPCPSSPPIFDGPVGQQIRIGVFIAGSNPMNVFQVTLLANHTFLTPIGVDLTNSVLNVGGSAVIAGECLQGVLKAGGACMATDTIDTLDLSASAPPAQSTGSGTTGFLFTAIYNITGIIPSASPVSVGFQTGCITSSVSGPSSVCVTISDGPTIDPQTVLGASFNNFNSATMPDVILSSNQTSFGPEFPRSNTANVTATAENGYPLTGVTDLVNFTTTTSSTAVTAAIVGANTCATGGISCSVTLGLTTTAAGNYSVTVFGTYATNDGVGNDTLVANMVINIFVYDITLAVSPTSVSFISGSIGAVAATLTSIGGFSGSVTLSTNTIIGTGLTISYDPSTVTLAAAGSGRSQVATVIFSASPTGATTYHATIKALASGSKPKISPSVTVSVSAPAPDFYLIANPTILGPVDPGVKDNSTITVTYVNGFSGTVSLTPSPSTGLNAMLNSTSVTSSHNVTLTLSSSTIGGYTVKVTGTSGSTSHSTGTITLNVVDFSLTASNASLRIVQGTSKKTTIGVEPLNGFVGTASLTVTASSGLSAFVNSTSVVALGSAILNVTAGGATPVGQYSVNVTGTSGSLTHSVEVVINVVMKDFSIVPTPATISEFQYANGASLILLSSLNTFTGAVTLSVSSPSGVLASLNATSVTLLNGGTARSQLTVNSTRLGTFLVNVTGVSGSLSHTVTITVQAANFTITAPAMVTVDATVSQPSIVTVTWTGGFSGTVTLTLSESTGLTASTNPSTVQGNGTSTLTLLASAYGNYIVNVTGTSGSLHVKAEIHVAAVDFSITSSPSTIGPIFASATGNSTITISAENGFTGTIQLTDVCLGGTTCPLNQTSVANNGAVLLKFTGSNPANYQVNITATSGSLSHTITVNVIVVDFSPTVNPDLVTLSDGSSQSVQLTVTSQNGFAGQVNLYWAGVAESETSPYPSLSLVSSLTLTANGSASTMVDVTVANDVVSPGLYKDNITATVGTHMVNASILIDVPGATFKISGAAPAVAGPSELVSSVVTITSENGLFGNVNMTISSPSTSFPCVLSRTMVYLQRSGSNSTTVSCKGPPGNYNVTITGTGTTPFLTILTLSGHVVFVVADFSIGSTPTGILVDTGQQGHAQIKLSWTNNFNGTVNLATSPPSGLNATFSSSTVTGSGTATLNVVSNVAGVYTLVVNATSGSTYHTVTITVTVSSVSGLATILGLAPAAFYSLVGLLIVAAAGASIYLYLRSKRSRKVAKTR
jgi:hypothetical protein